MPVLPHSAASRFPSRIFLHACRRRMRPLIKTVALPLIVSGMPAAAMAYTDFERTLYAEPKREWWMNMGAVSQHFSQASRFNQENSGFGLEYQLDRQNSLVIGQYRNSVRETTRYLGAAWMPLAVGKFKFGVLAGVADGYPEMRGSGFFPVALPLMVFESGRVGLNFTVVPAISSKVAGCVAMQIKFRFQ